MKKNAIFSMVFLLSMLSCAEGQAEDPILALSNASFGTTNSRVQISPRAAIIKYSPAATSFDDVTGASYRRISNTSSYLQFGDTNVAEIAIIDENTVTVTINGTNTQTFTPKAPNLGARPY